MTDHVHAGQVINCPECSMLKDDALSRVMDLLPMVEETIISRDNASLLKMLTSASAINLTTGLFCLEPENWPAFEDYARNLNMGGGQSSPDRFTPEKLRKALAIIVSFLTNMEGSSL